MDGVIDCFAACSLFLPIALTASAKERLACAQQFALITHQALTRIAAIYKLEVTLKDLSAENRLQQRQSSIKPLIDEYFAWAKACLTDTACLPKGKTAEGLNYSLNHEKYLKVFLTNGDVPIDNFASERSIRPFTVGRKNWNIIYSVKGAQASAVIYSITGTTKLNCLNPYYYIKYLPEQLPYRVDSSGKISSSSIDDLIPWSTGLPNKCHIQSRS